MKASNPEQPNERIENLKSDIKICRFYSQNIAFLVGVTDDLIAGTRGAPNVAFARQLAMYMAHAGFGMTAMQVALSFDRDRSTLMHTAKKIEDLRDDTEFDLLLDEVGEILGRFLELKSKFQAKISDPKFKKKSQI